MTDDTLILSGWSQAAEGLLPLAAGARSFDYSAYPTPEAAIAALGAQAPRYVIAWSLGGQLALRAIAAGALRPQHLTLIAAPTQFIHRDATLGGMDATTYQLFHDSYARDPARTAARFHTLVAKGDRDAKRVMERLTHHPDLTNTDRWLPWLTALAAHTLDVSTLASAPPTLIIHGMNDAIVPPSQSQHLAQHLPRARLSLWAHVAHAPHAHDPARLRTEIAAHRADAGVE